MQAKKLPIEQACDLVGSQRKLSALLGVKPAAVNQWCLGRRPVPVHHCKAIDGATNGQVTCKDLRPDDWHLIWPELAEKAEA